MQPHGSVCEAKEKVKVDADSADRQADQSRWNHPAPPLPQNLTVEQDHKKTGRLNLQDRNTPQRDSNMSENTEGSASEPSAVMRKCTLPRAQNEEISNQQRKPKTQKGEKGPKVVKREICIATINVRGMGRQQQKKTRSADFWKNRQLKWE